MVMAENSTFESVLFWQRLDEAYFLLLRPKINKRTVFWYYLNLRKPRHQWSRDLVQASVNRIPVAGCPEPPSFLHKQASLLTLT
jgi:hypothetical protein